MRWAALSLALGCAPVGARSRLPDGAVAIVELEGGGYATAFLDLRGRGGRTTVRAAEGSYAAQLCPDGGREPAGEALTSPGPGAGFHLRRVADRLELRLPRSDDDRWTPALHGVSRLERACWVNTHRLSRESTRILKRELKEVVSLVAERAPAHVDGELDEWDGARASVVERPTQVLAGMRGWSGPRDAAFGVAARDTSWGLVLALRVRDDQRDPGDHLEILDLDRRIVVPMAAGGAVEEGPGWRAAFGEAGWQGQGLEILLEGQVGSEEGTSPVVQYVDADPGEAETRLGTAATPALGALAAAP